MPRLFERFYRAENTRSRTHEGSGIGLALVQELAKLHGGSVLAESKLGKGSTFIVTIPLGATLLSPDRIGAGRGEPSTAIGAGPYVEEALRWLPEMPLEAASERGEKCATSRSSDDIQPSVPPPVSLVSPFSPVSQTRPRVLVADDNADMRQYIARLLSERYAVHAVPDGEAALAAARDDRPDLILSDVMMPKLDGFGLLRELRGDPATATIPVILLSARAGEESQVEGLAEGADDYLIKPFSARELLARVRAHLEMAMARREAEAEIAKGKLFLERIAQTTPDMLFVYDLLEQRNIYVNRSLESVLGYKPESLEGMNDPPAHFVHPDDLPAVRAWQDSCQTMTEWDIHEIEHRARHRDGSYRWILARATVFERADDGKVKQIIGVATDITARKRTEETLRESRERLRTLAEELEHLVEERTQELVQSQDRLRALATELNLAEQRERKRLATELHDHLQQMLVLGKLKLGQGKRLAQPVPACADVIQQTDDILGDALNYTRTLVADLSPPVLREHGLAAGLRWLAGYMKRHDMTVTVQIPESDDLKLPEDQAILLFQSARELLFNASKHGGTGEATLSLARQNGSLRIEIRDKGQGFIVEAAAAAAAAAHSVPPSKFGLFSIRERMKALGGSFEINSAPGQGTTATLMLPLGGAVAASGEWRVPSGAQDSDALSVARGATGTEDSSPLAAHHASRVTHHASRIRVLLVDDHAMVRQGLRSVLEAYPDIDVVGEAQDGEEAIDQVIKHEPAVVLMDINMPKMNGIEATARIKIRRPEVAVVGLSVNAGGDNAEAMKRAGAALLLTKEAAVDQLYKAIQDVLKRAASEEALKK